MPDIFSDIKTVRRTFFQTKLSRALIAIAMLFVLAWWNPGFIMRPIASAAQIVAFPFERAFSFLLFEVRDVLGFIGSIGELKTENERLIREHRDLLSDQAALHDIRSENESLRKELGLAPRTQYDLISAEVIGEDILAQGKALIINQGSGSSISVGMPVVVGKGILIGRIDEVFVGSARVRLLSHPDSLVAAMTTEGEAKGAVRGEHGLGVLFDMVPRTDVLERGHSVVTSGLGAEFTRGPLIGTLQDPRYTTDKLFQQASVVAPVKYADIRFVSVIVAEKL